MCGRFEHQAVPPKLLKAVSVADRFRRNARSVQSTLTELKPQDLTESNVLGVFLMSLIGKNRAYASGMFILAVCVWPVRKPDG